MFGKTVFLAIVAMDDKFSNIITVFNLFGENIKYLAS